MPSPINQPLHSVRYHIPKSDNLFPLQYATHLIHLIRIHHRGLHWPGWALPTTTSSIHHPIQHQPIIVAFTGLDGLHQLRLLHLLTLSLCSLEDDSDLHLRTGWEVHVSLVLVVRGFGKARGAKEEFQNCGNGIRTLIQLAINNGVSGRGFDLFLLRLVSVLRAMNAHLNREGCLLASACSERIFRISFSPCGLQSSVSSGVHAWDVRLSYGNDRYGLRSKV